MLIYVIRHGETPANMEGKLSGWTDDPLNENGRRLAVITGRNMKGIVFDECFSSPLSRARETAEIVLRESGNEIPVIIDDRIKEIFVGDWEGVSFRDPDHHAFIEDIKTYFLNPFELNGCPNGENARAVCERTQAFLKELMARDDDRNYLVSTHGFAMRAMLNFLYDHPEDFWQSHMPYNCCVNIIEAHGGKGKVIAFDKVYYSEEDIVDHYSE
ncbi:MAG: histidine phosphatase family protein [Solobacterium sp.]|nr:histidine phosphatase family protein [Solobacterium sp.]